MRRLFGRNRSPRPFEFRCSCCGELHRGSPSFGMKYPPYYFNVPEEERAERVEVNADLFTAYPPEGSKDQQTVYAIRATLDVPIHGAPDPFNWGIWVSQSEESFERYVDTFSDDQTGLSSFGWVPVSFVPYRRESAGEQIEHLAADVEWQAPGARPVVILREADHPFFEDQHRGISWDRAIEIAQIVMHGG